MLYNHCYNGYIAIKVFKQVSDLLVTSVTSPETDYADVTQLVEYDLAKVAVACSSHVICSQQLNNGSVPERPMGPVC